MVMGQKYLMPLYLSSRKNVLKLIEGGPIKKSNEEIFFYHHEDDTSMPKKVGIRHNGENLESHVIMD